MRIPEWLDSIPTRPASRSRRVDTTAFHLEWLSTRRVSETDGSRAGEGTATHQATLCVGAIAAEQELHVMIDTPVAHEEPAQCGRVGGDRTGLKVRGP